MSGQREWRYTVDNEFTIAYTEDDFCVRVASGDDCACTDCMRFDAELERQHTEHYWRARIADEILAHIKTANIPMASPEGSALLRAAEIARSTR